MHILEKYSKRIMIFCYSQSVIQEYSGSERKAGALGFSYEISLYTIKHLKLPKIQLLPFHSDYARNILT